MSAPQVKVRYLSQPGQVDLGIDARRVGTTMAEMIADLLQTQPCRYQMAGAGVAKAMRAMVRNLNPQRLKATADHMVHGACRQRTNRNSDRHEEFPPRTMRPTVLEVLKNRVTNGSHERVILYAVFCLKKKSDDFVGPVQIVDTQFAH